MVVSVACAKATLSCENASPAIFVTRRVYARMLQNHRELPDDRAKLIYFLFVGYFMIAACSGLGFDGALSPEPEAQLQRPLSRGVRRRRVHHLHLAGKAPARSVQIPWEQAIAKLWQ